MQDGGLARLVCLMKVEEEVAAEMGGSAWKDVLLPSSGR